MRKELRIEVRVRNCDHVFEEALGPGVLGKVDLVFDLEEKDYESPLFIKTLMDHRTALIDELVYTEVVNLTE